MERFNSEQETQPTQSNGYEYEVPSQNTNYTTTRWVDDEILSFSRPPNNLISELLVGDISDSEPFDDGYRIGRWLAENFPETYDAFLEQQEEQFTLFCKKHKDYGPDNLVRDTVQESIESILERTKDKLNRVHKLNRENGQFENESLIDSLNDISNYANISIIFLKGHWGK